MWLVIRDNRLNYLNADGFISLLLIIETSLCLFYMHVYKSIYLMAHIWFLFNLENGTVYSHLYSNFFFRSLLSFLVLHLFSYFEVTLTLFL